MSQQHHAGKLLPAPRRGGGSAWSHPCNAPSGGKGLCRAPFVTCHGQRWPKDGACPASVLLCGAEPLLSRAVKPLQSHRVGELQLGQGWEGFSSPFLGDINRFSSQIKRVPLCLGVMDQQSSCIPLRELWNVGGWVRSMVL